MNSCRIVAVCVVLCTIAACATAVQEEGLPPIYLAVLRCDEEAVRMELARDPAVVSRKDDSPIPLLHMAAMMSGKITALLLEHGVDPDYRDAGGNTALHRIAIGAGGSDESLRVLLAHGASVNASNEDDSTPLHGAVSCIEMESSGMVWQLIAAGADVNAQDMTGYTPLIFAVQKGDILMVRFLLACGADQGIRDKLGLTALHYTFIYDRPEMAKLLWQREKSPDIFAAAGFGDIEALRRILKANPDAIEARGPVFKRTPLHWAAEKGQTHVLEFLIDQGAEVDAQSWDGWTALHQAAHAGHKGCVELLIQSGAACDARAKSGLTPLQWAALEQNEETADLIAAKTGWDVLSAAALGKADVLKELLANGPAAAGLAVGTKKMTPLHVAAEEGHLGAVEILIAKGVRVDLGNYRGETPLHLAAESGEQKVVKALLDAGADPNAKPKFARTPLHRATEAGHVAVVRMLLLAADTDPNARNIVGRTALHLAAQLGHVEIAELLIGSGADVNARTDQGGRPLHVASWQGQLALAAKLLASGADLHAKDDYGRTPLTCAIIAGQKEVALYLLKNGGKE